MKKILEISIIMLFQLQASYSQSDQNSLITGVYSFKATVDSTSIFWWIDICKDQSFAMDTIRSDIHTANSNNINGTGLYGDIVEVSPPEIYGKYQVKSNKIILRLEENTNQKIILRIIDSLNVMMLKSDIKGPFKNQYGHKTVALRSNHICGDVLSYLNSLKWSYGTEGYGAQKRKSYWYYYDSLSETPWLWNYRIPDTGKVKKYLINER
jgi:hypothetical protein